MAKDCSALDSMESFGEYISTLRDITSENLTLDSMKPCQKEICTTLYGAGNADISGIGVIVGYIMELVLGILITTFIIILRRRPISQHVSNAIRSAFTVYADGTTMLAFSVQLAAVIIVGKREFGISANDFGLFDMEVTWAASVLTMIPTMLICVFPDELGRPKLRLCATLLTWFLFIVIFVTRMIMEFTRGQIGLTTDAVITDQEANNIEHLCFQGASSLSTSERIIFRVFSIGASLFCSVVILSIFIYELIRTRDGTFGQPWVDPRLKRLIRLCGGVGSLVFSVAFWAIPQVWAVLRLRSIQYSLAQSIGNEDRDNIWGFGQVIASIVFLPVFVEIAYAWQEAPEAEERKEVHDHGEDVEMLGP